MPGLLATLQLLAMVSFAAPVPDLLRALPWPLPWEDEPRSENPNQLTVALKYVVYEDESGQPVLSPEQARQVVTGVNLTYAACNLRFRVDDYVIARPDSHGLVFRPSSMSELGPIRGRFKADRELVVINTGPWDPSQGLGADGANAWTMMPGERTAGAVIEAKVAKNPGLVAHELGHYLGLRHWKDKANLMNPVIYKTSRGLAPEQCETLRSTASSERSYALRNREPARAPAAQAAGAQGG